MSAVTTWEALSSHTTGLIITVVFALISALALSFICGRTIRLGVKLLLQRDDEDTSKIPEMLFFCTQLGQYAASLVLSNVVITLSGLIGFKWISIGGVSAGPTCQAQAILMQIGMWANCYFTVAHGVHTCNSLILRLRQPRWLSAVVTVIGWAIALVAGLAPLHDSSAYGPAGVSCGVSGVDRMETFTLQALPVILAAAVSIIVYCVIFLALGGKLSLSGTDKLRKLNLKAQRGLDEFEEYRRFIRTIIRTMFWFPFAFVVLLLPTCIAHIMMYAGSPVPYSFDVFAHVSCSLLGFVNVCLLVNTYRVVSPVIRGPKQEPITVKTFGNDASGESPITQRPQTTMFSNEPVTIPSYKTGSFVRKSGHFTDHSRSGSSSSSADSSTGLIKHQKSRKYSRARMTYPRNILSPAELSRQINDGTPMSQKRGSGFKSTGTPSPGLVAVSLRPPPHRTLSGGEQLESGHLVKEKKRLVRQSTEAFGKNAKDLVFKSKAPPALNLPSSMMAPSPMFTREITNKSATLADRLGIHPKPASSAKLSAASTVVLEQLDKGKGKASPPPFTPIRKKSRVRRPSVVLEVRPFDLVGFQAAGKGGIVRPNSRSSISSSVSGASAPNSDNDSDYSHGSSVTVIRPLPGVPAPDDSDATDSDASSDLSPERRHGRRTTMSSIWSQESRQTLQPLELEAYLAMKALKANGSARNAVDAMPSRLRAPAGPRGPRSARPLKVASRLSSRLKKIVAPAWSPSGARDLEFKMILAPNDSAV